jgi:hypothetical protein
MAALSAIHAVTNGLAQYLTRAHQLSAISGTSCAFTTVGTTELKKLDGKDTTCSLFLHRVSLNEHVRNRLGNIDPKRPPLSLNLHLLMTVWADSAQKEQLVFAWVMRELTRLAVLDRSVLGVSAAFDVADLVQLSTEELSIDDLSKIWQMLAPPYRLSASFVARNVRIDHDDLEENAPVVATRLEFSDEVQPS